MGYILIKGQGLELIKLDTSVGTLSIKGKINSFNYLDNGERKLKKRICFLSCLNEFRDATFKFYFFFWIWDYCFILL